MTVGTSLAANHQFFHFTGQIALRRILSAITGKAHSVFVFKIGTEVIKDMPVNFFARTPRSTARRHHLYRMRAHQPIDGVDVVQVLFHNLITTQPKV